MDHTDHFDFQQKKWCWPVKKIENQLLGKKSFFRFIRNMKGSKCLPKWFWSLQLRSLELRSLQLSWDRFRSEEIGVPDRSRAFEDAANASWLHHIMPDRGKTSQIGLVPHRSEVRIAPDQSESLQLRWSQHECKQRCWVLLAWLRVAFGFLAWPCYFQLS